MKIHGKYDQIELLSEQNCSGPRVVVVPITSC